ncbi:magnesium citrate secondary transporter [Cognataquiflexum rubidum]|uniref:magnesium citrate secondary transporter n=1 Tax=Cognataquiflexum rubidum TaxID=2922273 RepID=UPI001F1482D6|nr:magnesium citrate secondary transporter [Cognataquiflexum rubidum]
MHAYLDDLLAMPVVLGITLQVFRWIHPLKNTLVFTKFQVALGWVYFSFLFEYALPKWSHAYMADILDVVCYGIGALIFYNFINVSQEKI